MLSTLWFQEVLFCENPLTIMTCFSFLNFERWTIFTFVMYNITVYQQLHHELDGMFLFF